MTFPDPGEHDGSTVARGMMQVDGNPGDVVKTFDGDLDGKELLRFIRATYDYRDICKARFVGDVLVPGTFRFLREFALAVLENDDDIEITVETMLPEPGSMELLGKLMDGKTPLVDNVCLNVKIPQKSGKNEFDTTIGRLVEALASCIVATREERLRTVSIVMEFDASSSMDMFDACISTIEKTCMKDDMYDGMKGIALNSFNVALITRISGKANVKVTSDMISSAVERLSDKLFDAKQVKVIPVHVSGTLSR
jgi:hypothetical protein